MEIRKYLTENRTSSNNTAKIETEDDKKSATITSLPLPVPLTVPPPLPQPQPQPQPQLTPAPLTLPTFPESSMTSAISKAADYQESNFFISQLTVDHYQTNPNENYDNFDFFVSSSSSSSSSDYGSMSFTESPPDFGDLLTFLDDVFLEWKWTSQYVFSCRHHIHFVSNPSSSQ